MRQSLGIVEIIPEIGLGKSLSFGELDTPNKVIIGIHVAGQGLKAGDPKRDNKSDREENKVVTPVHVRFPIWSAQIRGE